MIFPSPFIKICGIQTIDEAYLAIDAGATAIGLLVGLTHKAPDEVSVNMARDIAASVPSPAYSVMVTHRTRVEDIRKLADLVRPKIIQLHGETSVDDTIALRRMLPETLLIKAIHVTSSKAVKLAEAYSDAAHALLLDSRDAERLGGTGMTHDWSISASIVRNVTLPVILAGGLKPENVQEAIKTVKPAGTDVNSGVENNDGTKSPAKIRNFVRFSHLALTH